MTSPVRSARRTFPGPAAVLAGAALAVGAPLPAGAVVAAMPAPQEVDTVALESHARFLADDRLEGRGPASRGERIAALYLTSRLQELGVAPLPGHGYELPVPLTAVDIRVEEATLRIDADGEVRTLRPPAFYHRGGSGPAFRDVAGELLLGGSAAGAPAVLEGLDLQGRVVVLAPPWDGLHELREELRTRGAVGTLELIPDATFHERLRIVRGPTRYFLPDGVRDPANQSALPAIVGGPDVIEALGLAGEVPFESPVERARSLGRVRVELPHTTEARTGYNVAGAVRGADPRLRDEWIVYVAHYDHVGFGEPTAGDSIWNGFIDNAAGSATLLELARILAADPPARSVAFLFVTAEEQGLLGSNWFAHDPSLPLERVRAVLNIDGGVPPAPPVAWGLVGIDGSPELDVARSAVEARGWSVRRVEPGPQSDHWPFHLAGVPALMLFPGDELEGLSPEEADRLRERWLHAHTPDDEWSPDFPFSGHRRYAELALAIGRALAQELTPAGGS